MAMRPVCLAIPLAVLGSCSGGTQQVVIGPPPPAESHGTFVGPLCTGESSCKCRDVGAAEDGGAGVPDPGSPLKRYEFRLGPSAQPLWATVHGVTMYKSVERPEECW